MNLALPDIDPPVRIRFGHRLTDDELLRFCAESDPFRVERDKNGELIVMTPTVFESGGVEGDVFGELRTWAMQDGRGKAYGPNKH
jgi:Uma2 family endonuclease